MCKHTHPAIKEWAQQCLLWENLRKSGQGDKEESSNSLHGHAESVGFFIKGDATALDTAEIKKVIGGQIPAFRLCFLDKPKVIFTISLNGTYLHHVML